MMMLRCSTLEMTVGKRSPIALLTGGTSGSVREGHHELPTGGASGSGGEGNEMSNREPPLTDGASGIGGNKKRGKWCSTIKVSPSVVMKRKGNHAAD